MKQAKLEDYNEIAIKLIYFKESVETVWARCDLKDLQTVIDTIRWYRQFEVIKKKGDN